MAGRCIAINGVTGDEAFYDCADGQRLLADAVKRDERPRCMCRPGGVPLYISRRGTHYFLARLPGSGFLHDAQCPSGEDINLFSAADCYLPGVIHEFADGRQTVQMRDAGREDGVSLGGLLDLLLEASALNHFRPGEARGWRDIRARLAAAAEDISCEPGGALASLLILPEAFNPDAPTAGVERVMQQLTSAPAPRLVCAPMRRLAPSRYGWLLQLRHLATVPFWVRDEEVQRIECEAAGTLAFATPPPFALCLAEVEPGRDRGVRVLTLCVRRTDRRFMPCLSDTDEQLSNALSRTHHYFRPLRFDADWKRPLADFVVVDEANWTIRMSAGATGQSSLDTCRSAIAVMQAQCAPSPLAGVSDSRSRPPVESQGRA